jgi:hypothetical protein
MTLSNPLDYVYALKRLLHIINSSSFGFPHSELVLVIMWV